ncbi:MAG: hypothetical protein ACM33B_15565 [Pseudomonadota bacterium]
MAQADDPPDLDRRVASLGAARLEAPVRSALGDATARVTAWRHEPVAYDFLNPSSGGVYRFRGTAATGAGNREWSLVLKVTRSPDAAGDEQPLPPGLAAARREAVRWDRELLAYESGFLARLDGPLVAAACHGSRREDDDTGWLWLEDLGGDATGAWSREQWGLVGRALGAFDGRFAGDGAPREPWLGRRWLRVWTTLLTPYHFGDALPGSPRWDDPRVRAVYGPDLRARLAALWDARPALLAAVEALPSACAHLDAHRRNLFLRPGEDGTRVVAIDWGLVGLAPLGEEIASTLVGSVASGEVPAVDATALSETLYAAYLQGLGDAGWEGAERDVRLAYAAASGLRAFSVTRLDAAEEATLAGAATLVALLAELGEEASSLLA